MVDERRVIRAFYVKQFLSRRHAKKAWRADFERPPAERAQTRATSGKCCGLLLKMSAVRRRMSCFSAPCVRRRAGVGLSPSLTSPRVRGESLPSGLTRGPLAEVERRRACEGGEPT